MDELVTHADVAAWLPGDIRDALTKATPPEQRGWYTAEEAAEDGGNFVELCEASRVESRFIRGRR